MASFGALFMLLATILMALAPSVMSYCADPGRQCDGDPIACCSGWCERPAGHRWGLCRN